MTISEIKDLLGKLENKILKYDFDTGKSFIMNSRRKGLKAMIEEHLQKNDGDTMDNIFESLLIFGNL